MNMIDTGFIVAIGIVLVIGMYILYRKITWDIRCQYCGKKLQKSKRNKGFDYCDKDCYYQR